MLRVKRKPPTVTDSLAVSPLTAEPGCCLECGGKCRDGVSGGLRLTAQAARSMTASVGLVASVCQPSTLRMVICPEASSAQNSIAAVSDQSRYTFVGLSVTFLPFPPWCDRRQT